jgi:hypothetical protein
VGKGWACFPTCISHTMRNSATYQLLIIIFVHVIVTISSTTKCYLLTFIISFICVLYLSKDDSCAAICNMHCYLVLMFPHPFPPLLCSDDGNYKF